MDARHRFLKWCESQSLEPTAERWAIWEAALSTTLEQVPIVYGYFTSDDKLIGLFDAPTHPKGIAKPVPLYAAPVADVRISLTDYEVCDLWNNHYTNDPLGFARAVERLVLGAHTDHCKVEPQTPVYTAHLFNRKVYAA